MDEEAGYDYMPVLQQPAAAANAAAVGNGTISETELVIMPCGARFL